MNYKGIHRSLQCMMLEQKYNYILYIIIKYKYNKLMNSVTKLTRNFSAPLGQL